MTDTQKSVAFLYATSNLLENIRKDSLKWATTQNIAITNVLSL